MNARTLSSVLLVVIGSMGCRHDALAPDTPPGEAGAVASASQAPVDDVLLAWLSAARSLHHEADLAEDVNDGKLAVVALERLLAAKRPRAAAEIDEVLADTHARLGDLRSKDGDFDGAEKNVDAGLLFAKGVSYYRGHLFEVRGLVEERRAKALAAKGDLTGAAAAREAAKKAFEEAVTLNFEFIDQHGRDKGGAP